jgi:hypothetical protein
LQAFLEAISAEAQPKLSKELSKKRGGFESLN